MNLLIAAILNNLALAAVKDSTAGAIPAWLTLLNQILAQDKVAKMELVLLKKQIDQMVDEGREPSSDEWAMWKFRSDNAAERIHEAMQKKLNQ